MSPQLEMPDWGHSEAYGWLRLVELKLGNRGEAKSHWEKVLKIDPENSWVKFELMPMLEKE